MNYTLMPSLEHLTLVKIAISLWNQDDIRDIMALTARYKFPTKNILIRCEKQTEWLLIEDKVIEKVTELLLPEALEEKVLNFIKPVGLKMLQWLDYHSCLGINLPKNLRWTPQGTIDGRETAKMLIKDVHLDIATRYRLACMYCLKDDIRELWNRTPENQRKDYCTAGDIKEVMQQELVVLWTHDIKGQLSQLDNIIEATWENTCSPYQYAFEYAAYRGNKAATEYFLQKLTGREREESLVRSACYAASGCCDSDCFCTADPKQNNANVLCFLLSQMNEEQQSEVFKKHPYNVLRCLLAWPWVHFFMETANHMWDFLSEEGYYYLLKIISGFPIDSNENYYRLLEEFWQQSPNAHKTYVIDKCDSEWKLHLASKYY